MSKLKNEVKKHYDAWSATYEDEIWTRDEYFHNQLKRWVLNLISRLKNSKKTILEIGVGPGIYFKKFLETALYVVGIDISKKMLKTAKNNIEEVGFNSANFVQADAEYLPFRKKSFDIINCIEVIRHLPRPQITLYNLFKEIYKILSTQGSVLINMPNILFPANLLWPIYYNIPRYIMKLLKRGIGYHYDQKTSHFPLLYNEPEDHRYHSLFIKSLINKTGFKITLFIGIFFFPGCPKILFPIINKLDQLLWGGRLASFSYSFLIQLKRK